MVLYLTIKMKNSVRYSFSLICILALGQISAYAQDQVHYTGKTLNNPDYHHGQLSPAMGVHNIQVMRANREDRELADGFGWTYNHAPMLAYRNNTFYLEYLSDSVGEHVPPGHTLLVTSNDGKNWERPVVIFPRYKVPDGTTQPEVNVVAKGLYAVMHQRMGFYVSDDKRLLALGYYGICITPQDGPNDGFGIGRVVREIYMDGTFGPIYFIRYNKGWGEKNTDYPFYSKSKDKGFINACNQLLSDPLQTQQWNEESDRDDPLIPMHDGYQALSYYHLPDVKVVGLWKHALTAISKDEGKTWTLPQRAPGFVNSNAKIWGQPTSDGKYAAIYNPSDFRWPLAISVSDDGLEYKNLLLVNGEIPTMRYGGSYKSYGPQYVRGIQERNGRPADGKIWVTYSMNKEDIWVSSIPVPVRSVADSHVDDVFDDLSGDKELESWNIYSPVWAEVSLGKHKDNKCLSLKDKDEFDYAMASRLFPPSEIINVEFTVEAGQNDHGTLFIELQDNKNTAAMRLVFDKDGTMKTKAGYRMKNLMKYEAGQEYKIRIEARVSNRNFDVFVDDKKAGNGLFFAPVFSLQQLVFRTGEVRRFPNVDTPTDQDYDVKQDGKPIQEAAYRIRTVKTWSQAADPEIERKASEWAVSLNLNDPEKEKRITKVIAAHLDAVRNWHNEHPATTVPAGINPVTGRQLSELDRQMIADSEMPKSVHDNLMTGLRRDLIEEQVETILDKYTVGKVAFTMAGYHAIVPDLTSEEEKIILGFLKEAREMAVDYKSMKQISAIFEIYKTKSEQYLISNGRNWRALYKSYVDSVKAKKAAEEASKNK